jgi:hypothetical protein
MPTLSRERFRAALGALEREEFAAFVAALYRRRGRDAVVVDGDRLRIDGRHVHVHASGPGRAVPGDADAVVTPGTGRPRGVPAGVDVIDADALYERAAYGIGTDDRERLFARLDRAAVPAPSPAAGGPFARRFRWSHAAVGVVALALVVAGVFGAAPFRSVDAGSASDPDADSGGTGGLSGERTPFASGTNLTTTTATPTPTPLPPADYPAWLSADGSVDAVALARAHVRTVSGRAYTLSLTVTESRQGATVAAVRQRVAVRSPSVYRSTVSTLGQPVDPVTPRLGPVYADGDRAHVLVNRSNRSYRTGPPGTLVGPRAVPPGTSRLDHSFGEGTGPVAAFAGTYVANALATGNATLVSTSVVDGIRLFYLRVDGRSEGARGIDNVRSIAAVEADGFIRRLHRQYEVPTAGVTVSTFLRYEPVTPAVTPPAWYRNGTRVDRIHTPTPVG